MSGSKQITVTRNYEPEPDYCAQALELLLKTSVRKEGGAPAAPDNDGTKIKGDSADARIIPNPG